MPLVSVKAFWMEGNWAPALPTWRHTDATTVATASVESGQSASIIDAKTTATGRTEAKLA